MPPARTCPPSRPEWRPEEPFNALPPLPPATELETRAVLKHCISARAALAELKQAAELIPNQGVLINTLPLLEAQASSEIENILTTTDRLFLYRDGDDAADVSTKEALRYTRALLEGFQTLRERPLVTTTAEEICSLIKGREMRVRTIPGTALARSTGRSSIRRQWGGFAAFAAGKLGAFSAPDDGDRSARPHGRGTLPI